MYKLHIHKTLTILVFHVLKYFQMLKLFVVNLNLYILHNIPIFYVTYADSFNMHTVQPNPQSIINEYISGKNLLNNSNNKFMFPALNVSINFAALDYDSHINTKIDYTLNHIFRSTTEQELNTLHTFCELARNQLLTILAMSVQNHQFAGFLLTRSRSNFLYVEGSTAWLYECPHLLSPLYKVD